MQIFHLLTIILKCIHA